MRINKQWIRNLEHFHFRGSTSNLYRVRPMTGTEESKYKSTGFVFRFLGSLFVYSHVIYTQIHELRAFHIVARLIIYAYLL